MTDAARVFGAVVRNRDLRRELLAFLIFNAAEWAAWVAILVYAYDRGGTTAAGEVAVIQLIPAIFVAPLGSVLGDTWPKPRALAFGFAVQAATMALTAAVLRAAAPVAVIYLSAAAASCAVTLTRPVHFALLPELAQTPPELTAANSVSGILEGLAVFVGPLATGLLLVRGGAWLVFAVLAVALAVACLLVARLRGVVAVSAPADAGEPLLAASLEGFRELRREHAAALLTVLVGVSFVVIGLLDVLTVVLALEVLGMSASGPGQMTAALGTGSLIGAAATAVLVGRRRLVPGLFLGLLVAGLPLVGVAFVHAPAGAMLLLVVSGIGAAFFAVAGRTLLQRSVNDEVLARVFGLQEAMLMAGLAVGSAIAPVLVRAFGPRGAFVVGGALLPVAGLIAWPRLRTVDAAATVPAAELALLRAIPMFQPLAPPVLERLSRNLIPMDAPAGTVVIREGVAGDRFYIVAQGRVSITSEGRFLAERGPGGYVGEIALLRDVPRTATVTASVDTHLLAMERAEFLAAVTGSRVGTARAHAEVDRKIEENRRAQHNRNNLG